MPGDFLVTFGTLEGDRLVNLHCPLVPGKKHPKTGIHETYRIAKDKCVSERPYKPSTPVS